MALGPGGKHGGAHANLRKLSQRYWGLVRKTRLFLFIPAWISISALAGIWLSSQLPFILSMRRHDPNQVLIGTMSGHGGGIRLILLLGFFFMFFWPCLLFLSLFLMPSPSPTLMSMLAA